MIQHIQSFMSGKAAARSSLLSKSWYNAWLTRPSLDFDYRYFRRGSSYKFHEFAKKTMQRYQDSSLKIDSIRLCVWETHYGWADKLIVNAMTIGATDVQLRSTYSFTLPQEVLGSQTLLKLSLTNCKVDKKSLISCWRLRSLTLENVKFTSGGGDVLKDILRCCITSLEELSVVFPSSISILPQEVLGSQNLYKLSLTDCRVDGNYIISCSTLKSLTLDSVILKNVDVFRDIITCCISMEELSLSICNGFSAVRGANTYELRKLRRLFLSELSVDSMFFTDFASMFPCLEDLSIHDCDSCKKVQIASTSLQTISFKPKSGLWRAKFYVPNIRKFTYSGSCLPSDKLFVNAAASREWEFDISITCNQFYRLSWFLNLQMYLTKFSLSRISLSIDLNGWSRKRGTRSDDSEHEVDVVVAAPEALVLENLMIKAPSSYCCALLVRLFGICRPKFITHDLLCRNQAGNNASLDVLCKRLITPNMFGQFDLKKVNVEVYEMCDTEWWPLLLEEPLDATKTPENKRKVRFELIWD